MTTTETVRVDDLKAGLEWLKWVAGVDDDYLARWDVAEWAQWYRAMDASIGSGVNPCVPSWINEIIHNDWSRDWSQPWPCIGQLWPTAHDWFVAEANHDDFVLQVAQGDQAGEAGGPHLSHVWNAWWAAHEHPNAAALLRMDLLPPAPGDAAVIGEISAFYVVSVGEHEKLTRQLEQILGQTSDALHGNEITVNTMAVKAGVRPIEQARMGYQWDWMQ